MKILVCGSEGSLMQAVIPLLVKKGHIVIGCDNLFRYGKRFGQTEDYLFYKGDLLDYSKVEYLMREHKPDYVIQAAAKIYGVGGFNAHCAEILGDDISLHRNVLTASAKSNTVKRVIYISSSMVYETCFDSQAVSEELPDECIPPLTDYGLSKYVGERLSRSYSKQYDLDFTIWRPFNIISPFEKAERDQGTSHVFADFIHNIVLNRSENLAILGDGNQVRCFTWIDEVAQCIADFSFSEETKNEVFNVGNREPVTMLHLAKRIHSIANEEFGMNLPDLTFYFKESYKNDVLYRVPDVSKIKNVLGWEAQVKLDNSLRKCIKELFRR